MARAIVTRLASAAALAALTLGSAQAALVMEVGARSPTEPPGNNAGENYFDSTASQVLGSAVGGDLTGASAEIVLGQSRPPDPCPNCLPFDPLYSRTWAGVDAQAGILRGSAISLGGMGPGDVPLGTSSAARFGIRDLVHLSAGPHSLGLALDLSWYSNALAYEALTFLNAEVGLWKLGPHSHCDPQHDRYCVEQEDDPDAGLTFIARTESRIESGYQWNDENFTDADAYTGQRRVNFTTLAEGDYLLAVEFDLESYCGGADACATWMDFSHTGYVGLGGDYTSASGYLYPGVPSVPEPATLALWCAGLLVVARAAGTAGKRG